MTQAEPAKPAENKSSESDRAAGSPASQPALLIVEDDEITACYMQEVLGNLYDCQVAYNLNEALKVFNEKSYALILTDMHLLGGVLDGYAVLEAARRSQCNQLTPVAAITGLNLPRSNFIQAGFDGLLYKPYTPDELLDLVKQLVY